jgi:hypothetical protein
MTSKRSHTSHWLSLLLIVGYLLLTLSFQTDAETSRSADISLETLPTSTLIYVSDYFSFVGKDNHGHVAFALDNNRGRDGEAYQAEHFLVLHDERQGWMDVAGNGPFENRTKELSTIPDSSFFRFQGTPRTGMTITSETNQLTLTFSPIPQRTSNRHAGGTTWMGSAPAILTWKGRTLAGRVIYEYFMMPEFNRLTRTYWGMWKEFQGLYLLANQTDDVYVHSQLSERIAPLVGKLAGFAALNDMTESMKDITVEALDRDWALGAYRWPTAWRVTWTSPKGPATITLSQSARKGLANWVTGGFSMSIVQGELEYAGKKYPIYGLAELIM